QQRGEFRVSQTERAADRRQQRGVIEPDHKTYEEGEPGEMENSDSRLEPKKIEESMRLRLHAHTPVRVLRGMACAPLRNAKTAAGRAMLVPAVVGTDSRQ